MNPQPTLIEEDQGSARDLSPSVSSPIVDGDLPDLDALERVAKAATQGEWIAGHLCRDDHPCNCPYVLSEGYMGSICTVDVLVEGALEDGGNDNPPLEEAKGNQRHIATFDPPTALALIASNRALTARVDALESVCKLAEQGLHRAYCATRSMEDADAFENARDRIRAALNPLPNPVEGGN